MTAIMFTAEDAFDADESDFPIMLSRRDAERICGEHYTRLKDYLDDPIVTTPRDAEEINAASLLAWLGY